MDDWGAGASEILMLWGRKINSPACRRVVDNDNNISSTAAGRSFSTWPSSAPQTVSPLQIPTFPQTTYYPDSSAVLLSNNVLHAVICFTFAADPSPFSLVIRDIHSPYPSPNRHLAQTTAIHGYFQCTSIPNYTSAQGAEEPPSDSEGRMEDPFRPRWITDAFARQRRRKPKMDQNRHRILQW